MTSHYCSGADEGHPNHRAPNLQLGYFRSDPPVPPNQKLQEKSHLFSLMLPKYKTLSDAQGQQLDLMNLVGPFQLRISVVL